MTDTPAIATGGESVYAGRILVATKSTPVSVKMGPCTLEPSPYDIEKVPLLPLLDVDDVAS